ncbi:MAG: aminopeptidase N [Proteobacteria bacterium]|nr:aminopeptidase N [Pseudomonadota bacterium]
MNDEQRVPIYSKDYTVYDYLVEHLHLNFELYENQTIVTATAKYQKNPASQLATPPLLLFGEKLELVSISVNGVNLPEGRYRIDDKSLCLDTPPIAFTLTIVTRIDPAKNRSLEGLYRSSGNYCTQCEAEGFRTITYYPDRPDVLTRFTTRIEADRQACPVMLSNGNLLESGSLDGDRHYVVWQDPFPKPCYLFALVAGRLVSLEDKFVTRSGKIVNLKIYVEKRNEGKCRHAMDSLKKAMHWDEQVYGLEYDLDTFMIVAVDDFNMGAMENKGLNVFNAKYVLSSPESATDQDYLGIEGVVAHEYFHNWTGNRVTCRDWFQLSLKEGLTVFRDQEFSSDMNSPAVQRIDDVRMLKNFQFKEDAGPMAHPVRPDCYMEINNFYTATVYNKGAEVIRMMYTLLGKEKFRLGMDLYFARHDGQAVTCDDFVAAMNDASGVDLDQFKNWYSQAGTPVLSVKGEWLEHEEEYRLVIRQNLADTPGRTGSHPFHMPLAVGLVGATGKELLKKEPQGTAILQLREREQLFVFQGIKEQPVVSFLRNFSAPVRVAPFQSRKELAFLMRYDSNLFNRWDASARLASEVVLEAAEQLSQNLQPGIDDSYIDAVYHSLRRKIEDPALLALSLTLPPETTLAQDMEIVDPDSLHKARQLVKSQLAEKNSAAFMELYLSNREGGEYLVTAEAMGRRSLKNVALAYLMALDPLPEEHLALCVQQYRSATNMTDCIAALANLVNLDHEIRLEVLDDFYSRWVGDPLVLDKWFTLQALSVLPSTLHNVALLTGNTSFSIENPNKVRALIGAFCSNNHVRFHEKTGAGYTFLADKILELNTINPQIAARLVAPLINWKRYDIKRQSLMREQLERIIDTQNISRDVYEIVDKSR